MTSREHPVLKIKNLQVSRGSEFNLSINHVEIYAGEVIAIIGPNGAGKSTLLLALSKLLEAKAGSISLRGKSIEQIADLEYRRQIALVLQEPLLLDTSVFNNIAAGLRFRGISKSEINQRIDEWLIKLNISHLKDRPASQLSGGQAQRVSLARAMVLKPTLLLLDEPFSALDTPTRMSLMQDLRNLLSETATTTIFITHDQEQALFLGDRIAVLLDGKIAQIDSPQNVFSSPIDTTVANFLGIENILPGYVMDNRDGKMLIDVEGKQLEAIGKLPIGKDVFFCVRPEEIILWNTADMPKSSARNQLDGQITSISNKGPLQQINLDCGFPLIVLITRASAQELDIEPGMEVCTTFKASAVHLIPR
ncbi:MAG: ABC transporter ATP-binding protein [Anaerolineales bacterium]